MKGSRAKGRGGLENCFRVLRAARDAFFFAPMASQTTRGAALCTYERYAAYAVKYLPF